MAGDRRVQITLDGAAATGVGAGGAVHDATDASRTAIISTHVPRGEPGRSGTLPQVSGPTSCRRSVFPHPAAGQ